MGTNGPVLLVTLNDVDGVPRSPSLVPFAPEAGGALNIDLRAAPWIPVEEIRIFVNGTLVHQVPSSALAHPADPFGTLDTIRYQASLPLSSLLNSVAPGQDAWLVVEAGMIAFATEDIDGDGLPDGVEEPPRPADTDPRFHAHIISPGLWPGAFTNPLLLELTGDGWDAPGLP